MANLFGHVYSLLIARNVPLDSNVVPRYLARPVEAISEPNSLKGTATSDYRQEPLRAFLEYTTHQMTADVYYSKRNTTNGGSQSNVITITGISRSEREQIRSGDVVILRASYRSLLPRNYTREDLQTVFVGQIQKVSTDEENVTSLTCGDSLTVRKNLKISQSWPRNTSKRTVLQDMLRVAADAGVPTGAVLTADRLSPLDEVYISGYSVNGLLFDEITDLCNSIRYRFYLVNGIIYIEPLTTTQAVARVTLTRENIKYNIEIDDNSSGVPTANPNASKGIQVRTFLDTRLTPEKIVTIDTGTNYDGDYKILSTGFELNYEDGPWDTVNKLTRLG